MSENKPMLEIKGVHKTFNAGTINEKKALRGVDSHSMRVILLPL